MSRCQPSIAGTRLTSGAAERVAKNPGDADAQNRLAQLLDDAQELGQAVRRLVGSLRREVLGLRMG